MPITFPTFPASGSTAWYSYMQAVDAAARRLGPHVLVASTDAPTGVKDRADFVCDGTADQTEINSAIDLAAPLQSRNADSPASAQQRGMVLLSGGRFNCSGAILMRTGVRLTGMGYLSEIRAVSCNATGLIKLAGVNEHGTQVDNLYLYGNYSAGGTCNAIDYDMTGSTNAGVSTYPATNPDANHQIHDLLIWGFDSGTRSGIKIWCTSTANNRVNRISGVLIRDISQHGIWLQSASDDRLSDIEIGGCTGGSGFYIDTSNCRLTNCKAFYCDGTLGAFYINSDYASLAACEAQESVVGFTINGLGVIGQIQANVCQTDGVVISRSQVRLDVQVTWKTGLRWGSTPTTNGIKFTGSPTDVHVTGHVDATSDVTNRVVSAPTDAGSILAIAGGGTRVTLGV